MKKLPFLLLLLATLLVSPVSSVFAQNAPTILINGVPALANNINANPYWLGAGQTVAIGNKVNAISVLLYNLAPDASGGYKLQFEGAISVTSQQTVPTDKVWKIESVAIDPSATLGSGDNWGGQSVEVNTTLSGQGTTTSPLGIAQQGATPGQNLQWNGSAWLPATPIPQGVTNVATGAGLTGGPVTSTGTISLANGTSAGQVFITGSSPFTPALVPISGDASVSPSGVVKVNALESATTTVNVNSAAAPTAGQILTATSPTTATWQTPSGGATCSTSPATPGAISGNAATCTGSIGTYFVAPVNSATSYTWTYTGTGATVSSTSNSIVISFSTSATSGNLSVTATNACGTSSSSVTFAITVNGTPNSNFTYSPSTVNFGTSVTFTPSATDNQLYFWTFPGPNYSTSTNPSITWTSNIASNVTLTVTKNGCNATTVVNLGPTPAAHGSITYNVQGGPSGNGQFQTFVVPTGITSITITATGGDGYTPWGTTGYWRGGTVAGTLAVSQGQVYTVSVGASYNGCCSHQSNLGENGNYTAGDASSVRYPTSNLTDRIIVAGAGGGGGYNNGSGCSGGVGGGSTGASGTSCNGTTGGGGGSLSAGGTGGTGVLSNYNGVLGSLGAGGVQTGNAGGGGGGYYGGGSGGWNNTNNNGSGGGGGSSYISPLFTSTTNTQATGPTNGIDPTVVITW